MFTTLPIGTVQIQGEIGRRIDNTIRNNMLAVDIDRDFLDPFRKRDAESAYIGLGHFFDALARFAAYRDDPEVEALRTHILSTLGSTRESNGYIGIFPESRRLARLWDTHESSHLIYGLATDHRYRPDGPSLALAEGLAGWLIREWRDDPNRAARQFVMATLDLEPSLLNLYAENGDDDLLDFCTRDRDLPGWNRPIIEGRWGRIEGHIYDYLSRCIAQLNLMRWRPGYHLTRATRRALDYMLQGDGMLITGETGDHECWHSSQEGTIHLGETCATAYLLRLLDILLRQTGESFYGDLIERVMYNALFAAQSPDGRQIRYYTPIDGPRKYFDPDTYCCPNNFRRIMSELPGMVCYETADGVAINLYTESALEATTPDGTAVKIRMSTSYPSEGGIEIEVVPEHAGEFAVDVRIPRWCGNAHVQVNAEGVDADGDPIPGGFYRIRRTWNRGDVIRLDLPMPVRLVSGRKAQAGRFAVMRGPTVFSLNRNRHAELAQTDLRLIVVDPGRFDAPERDDSVRPDGRSVRGRAWAPDTWYPVQDANLDLTLTEFSDPDGELVYFKPPVPNDSRIIGDELLDTRVTARGIVNSSPSVDNALSDGGDEPIVADDFYEATLGENVSNLEDGETLRRLQS